jgi:pimeloyl-ACP methyl ester carboxylesterase
VHGAWHGGWCWERVRTLLEASGADVHTPTLTGLGDRADLVSPDISLETHIADIVDILEDEDLSDVVLVGHSYSGMVVTAVADRAAARVARVIYLDAIVPRDGQSLCDRVSQQAKAHFEEQVRDGGEGWLLPVSVASPQFLGLKSVEDQQWVIPRLVPHPFRTMRDAVRLSTTFPKMPLTYVNCIGDKSLGQPRGAQAEGIEDYHELQTGHDAMVTAPAELSALLRQAAL